MPLETRYLSTAAMDEELTMIIGSQRRTIVVENEPADKAFADRSKRRGLLREGR